MALTTGTPPPGGWLVPLAITKPSGNHPELDWFERRIVPQLNERLNVLGNEISRLDRTTKVLIKQKIAEGGSAEEYLNSLFITTEEFYTGFNDLVRRIDQSFNDKSAPATPAGTSVVATVRTAEDGSVVPKITVTWNKNTEPDVWFYQVSYLINGVPIFVDKVLPASQTSTLDPARGGVTYTINVRAVDDKGNWSPPTGNFTITPDAKGNSEVSTDNTIGIGGQNVLVDGTNARIIIKDNQNPQITRAIIGKTGGLVTDWGIQVFGTTGNLILDINSLGVGIVGTAQIADAAITNAKIANLAVDSAKIANLAVNSAHIVDLSVGSLKIANNAVLSEKISPGAVTATGLYSNNATVSSTFLSETFVGSVLMSSQGGVMDIKCSFVIAHVLTPSTGAGTYEFRLRRNGTLITQSVVTVRWRGITNIEDALTVSIITQDSPGSGSITYQVNVIRLAASTTPSNVTVRNRRMAVAELRR